MKNREPVLVFVPDLFFQAKIMATARATGSLIHVLSSPQALIEECREEPGRTVIVDLSAGIDAIGLIQAVLQECGTGTHSIVGFYSHVDRELERRAREAGCDLVLPKSAFSKRLPEILTGAQSMG